MNRQNFSTSSFAVRLSMLIGTMLPKKTGYALADLAAKLIARRKEMALVQTVMANQWVIHGGKLSMEELERITLKVIQHAGYCNIDLYKYIRAPEKLKAQVLDTPETRKIIRQSQEARKGCILVTPHVSNFDLALMALAYRGLKAQVLTYNHPTSGYELHNKIREKSGLAITPINQTSLRKAIKLLKNGGTVITGVDRPTEIPEKCELTFFNRPTNWLPTGHIRLAKATGAVIVVGATQMNPDGKYQTLFSDPLSVQPYSDPEEEIQRNCETILRVIEEAISQRPDQWLMYYPIWPETIPVVRSLQR
ncbi:MAG: lysophospholipid acyltransferase family protein [Anaerolineales bacterium]|nr:lysophospholipid acyltransferase family protein [Anaerolineales bacterium]